MERQPNGTYLNMGIIERLSAFYLYKSHGLETACNVYPNQRRFILENRNKSLEEVRKEAYKDLYKRNDTHLL